MTTRLIIEMGTQPNANEPSRPILKRLSIGAAIATILLLGALVLVVTFWQDSGPAPFAILKVIGGYCPVLSFDSSGKYLIVASTGLASNRSDLLYNSCELSIWDIGTQTKLHTVVMPQITHSISLSKDRNVLAVVIGTTKGRYLYNGGDVKPRQIRLYSVPELKELGKIECEKAMESIHFSPDGNLFGTVAIADEHTGPAEITIWDANTLKPKHAFKFERNWQTRLRFSPDGKTFTIYHHKHLGKIENAAPVQFRAYDSATAKVVKEIKLPRRDRLPLVDFEVCADEKKLVLRADYGSHFALSLLDIASENETTICAGRDPNYRNWNMAFSNDRQWLITVEDAAHSRDRHRFPPRVRIWDSEGKKAHVDWKFPDIKGVSPSAPIAISPDKKTLAVGSDKVYLFDLSKK